ncbi:hypothetical protein GALMADRAFT_1359322 [Galerina marginata CBS 339.88]|uniref:C2 domain-containing protein n=1 Tax=Galerina marginata (strain CBS 339.88) TaxID=685588 RepID=A0A067S7F7_GALM3|nr:hypothetical protein GALMADRAFT_1359322 [Galerina marginata CBS 339.88]
MRHCTTNIRSSFLFSSLTLIVLCSLNMATDKPLLLSALLGNVEVEGDIKTRKREMRSQYSVRLYVDDKKVAKSPNQPASSILKWEWNTDNQIWFEPSSIMKIAVYRGFGTAIDAKDLVGQHQANIVDLLENSASLDLTDEKGIAIPIKMKIALSPIAESEHYIKEFMEKVDTDVSRLSSNGTVASTVSTLGQVLKLTKNIMDQLSKAHPILSASWAIVSNLYQAVQETDIQDESIRELASTLRELLGTANTVPNLPEIPDTTKVIEEISRQSLQVASLIHEYTKLHFAKRTVQTQVSGNLKSRIGECQKRCAVLKDTFYSRLHIDTNIQVKEIKANLQQTGRKLQTIEDDRLGTSGSRYLR